MPAIMTPPQTVVNACHNVADWKRKPGRDSDKERERAKMPKETTHRDPEKRADRIERRAKKRADTVSRKQTVKMRKARPLQDV